MKSARAYVRDTVKTRLPAATTSTELRQIHNNSNINSCSEYLNRKRRTLLYDNKQTRFADVRFVVSGT